MPEDPPIEKLVTLERRVLIHPENEFFCSEDCSHLVYMRMKCSLFEKILFQDVLTPESGELHPVTPSQNRQWGYRRCDDCLRKARNI